MGSNPGKVVPHLFASMLKKLSENEAVFQMHGGGGGIKIIAGRLVTACCAKCNTLNRLLNNYTVKCIKVQYNVVVQKMRLKSVKYERYTVAAAIINKDIEKATKLKLSFNFVLKCIHFEDTHTITCNNGL